MRARGILYKLLGEQHGHKCAENLIKLEVDEMPSFARTEILRKMDEAARHECLLEYEVAEELINEILDLERGI